MGKRHGKHNTESVLRGNNDYLSPFLLQHSSLLLEAEYHSVAVFQNFKMLLILFGLLFAAL